LYEEGEKQEKIFLIYKGECKLQKKRKKSDEVQGINSKITLINMSRLFLKKALEILLV